MGLDRYSRVVLPSSHLAKVGLKGEDSRARINELCLWSWSVEHGSGIFSAGFCIPWGQVWIRWVAKCVSHDPYFSAPPDKYILFSPFNRQGNRLMRLSDLPKVTLLISTWQEPKSVWDCFFLFHCPRLFCSPAASWYPFWLLNWIWVKQGFSTFPHLTSKPQFHFTTFPHVGITSYNYERLTCVSIITCASNVLRKTKVSFIPFPDKNSFPLGVNAEFHRSLFLKVIRLIHSHFKT